MSVTVREYLDPAGRSPYARWFHSLNAPAAAKVATALYRLELGNFSNVRSVGAGVYECKIDFGPGYRVYFGKIDASKKAWAVYKRAKPEAR